MTLKLVVVIPKSLGMSPGKMASQVSHATALAVMKFPKEEWEHIPVLIVHCKDLAHLYKVAADTARDSATWVFPFMDSRPTTQNTGGKITALAVFYYGADDKPTRTLKLVK